MKENLTAKKHATHPEYLNVNFILKDTNVSPQLIFDLFLTFAIQMEKNE